MCALSNVGSLNGIDNQKNCNGACCHLYNLLTWFWPFSQPLFVILVKGIQLQWAMFLPGIMGHHDNCHVPWVGNGCQSIGTTPHPVHMPVLTIILCRSNNSIDNCHVSHEPSSTAGDIMCAWVLYVGQHDPVPVPLYERPNMVHAWNHLKDCTNSLHKAQHFWKNKYASNKNCQNSCRFYIGFY